MHFTTDAGRIFQTGRDRETPVTCGFSDRALTSTSTKRDHVSLDAQDWVWNHSRSKGTARLVLLAIADKAYGKDCSAYAGTTMLVQRTNAARSSVVAAVDKLIETGELAVVQGKQGPRGETVYALPKARRHRRSGSEGGPESGPVQNPDRSENRTGTESGPGGSENRTPGGPKSGPHNAKNTTTKNNTAATPVDTAPAAKQTAAKAAAKKPNPHQLADDLTAAFWERHGKGRAQPFLAIRGVVRTAIGNGVERDDLARALDRVAREGRSVSGATLDIALGAIRQPNGHTRQQAPTAPRHMTEEEERNALQF